jgi:hypothetical protein
MNDDTCSKCGTTFSAGQRFCGSCGAPRTETTVDASSLPRKRASVMAVISIVIGVAGLVPFLFLAKGCKGSAQGNVVIAGGPKPGFTFTPTGCSSMQPQGHMGANLHGNGPNDGGVYVTMDPIAGPAVNVEIPGSCRNANGTDCTVFPVPRDHCTAFEADVHYTNVTVNDVRQVKGRLSIDCRLDNGTTVKGQVVFDGCS